MSPDTRIESIAADAATGSLGRGIAILRAIAPGGSRLSTLVAATGLPKPTVRRILVELMRANWVIQEPSSRLYHLGYDLVVLGAVAGQRWRIGDLARNGLAAVAERTGEIAYLSVRSGFDAVCIAREEGSAAIKVAAMDVGVRRPLGIGAGSCCLLAYLPDDEIRDLLRRRAEHYAAFPQFSESACLEAVAHVRAHGYAEHRGMIIDGLSGIGVPIFGGRRVPVAAISIAFITERLSEERRQVVLNEIQAEVARLERQLQPGRDSDRTRSA